MTADPFAGLSDDARLWIYPFDRPLTAAEEALVTTAMANFANAWQSHGAHVTNAFAIVDHHFLLLAGELADAPVSGCGIDASVRALRELHDRHGLNPLSHHLVFFRDAGAVKALTRPAFKRLAATGGIAMDTRVFDTTLTRLRDLRAGCFELPFAASWHATAFPLPKPA